jgi:hypothetical protein
MKWTLTSCHIIAGNENGEADLSVLSVLNGEADLSVLQVQGQGKLPSVKMKWTLTSHRYKYNRGKRKWRG